MIARFTGLFLAAASSQAACSARRRPLPPGRPGVVRYKTFIANLFTGRPLPPRNRNVSHVARRPLSLKIGVQESLPGGFPRRRI